MIQSLHYCALDEAQSFVPSVPTIAISILSPDRAPAVLHADITPVLRLYFQDATGEQDAPVRAGLFTQEHARAVVAFLRAHHDKLQPCHLMVHCEAGISRSAAVAVFAASECDLALRGKFAFLNPWVLNVLVRTTYPHYAF